MRVTKNTTFSCVGAKNWFHGFLGSNYHGVLQQILQFAQSAAPVTGVLSLDGFLELAEVRLTVPSVTHELAKEKPMLGCNKKHSSYVQTTLTKMANKSLNRTWK